MYRYLMTTFRSLAPFLFIILSHAFFSASTLEVVLDIPERPLNCDVFKDVFI